MGIRICPDCGGKVSDTRNDCPHCGHVFSNKIKCPDCGKELDKSYDECPECGHVFKTSSKRIEVIVERQNSLCLYAIALVVSIDGQQVGNLNSGQSTTFVTTPGLHNITIGKGANGPIGVNIVDGSRQIDIKPHGVLKIKCIVKTRFAIGFYVDIYSIEQD